VILDSWGLGYSRRGNALHVHYPLRDKNMVALRDADGNILYSPSGWQFDHLPEMQRNPSSERTALWTQLLGGIQE
jgi:hypothetical protein